MVATKLVMAPFQVWTYWLALVMPLIWVVHRLWPVERRTPRRGVRKFWLTISVSTVLAAIWFYTIQNGYAVQNGYAAVLSISAQTMCWTSVSFF